MFPVLTLAHRPFRLRATSPPPSFDTQRAVVLYAIGVSTDEIGRVIGYEGSLVRKYLRRIGVRIRPKTYHMADNPLPAWTPPYVFCRGCWKLCSVDDRRFNQCHNCRRREARQNFSDHRWEYFRRSDEYRRAHRKAEGRCTEKQWKARCEYFGWRCVYCAKPMKSPHRDHSKPLSKGGSNWPSNLVPCCRECNSRKRNRTLRRVI